MALESPDYEPEKMFTGLSEEIDSNTEHCVAAATNHHMDRTLVYF